MTTVTDTVLQGLEAFPNAATTQAGLAVIIAGMLYKYMTAPSKLSDNPDDEREQDLPRYERMCTKYLKRLDKPAIPEQWKLVDNCPSHYAELTKNAEYFRAQIENIRYSSGKMKTIIIKMISSIARLNESISKRGGTLSSWCKYRPDGFEAMFFSELVHWLSVEMAGASVTLNSTEEMVRNRIQYCQEVYDEVFIYRDDHSIHNPKERLKRIIDNLQVLHQDVVKSIEGAAFNKLIEQIDHSLLEMTTSAFDVLHLSLKDVNQEDLQVDEFLRPTAVDDKVIALSKTSLGQWLKLTLQMAGVTTNNFQGANNELDIESIRGHLNIVEKDLEKMISSGSGLPTFVTENKAVAMDVLNKVIRLHREILNIYYIRKSLCNAIRVGVHFGEEWLYGSDDGKTIVNALLHIVENANRDFTTALNDYWKTFYTDKFKAYETEHKLDNRDATVKYLSKANKRITRVKVCESEVQSTVNVLRKKAEDCKSNSYGLLSLQRDLTRRLSEYAKHKKNIDSSITEDLLKLTHKQTKALDNPKTMSIFLHAEAIEPHIVRLPKNKVLIYLSAMEVLNNTAGNQVKNLTLMVKPKKFYSDVHAQLYDKFLCKYHELANSGPLYSWLYSKTWFDMDRFRDFYSRINTVMNKLYSQELQKQIVIAEPTVFRANKLNPKAAPEEVLISSLSRDELQDSEYLIYQKFKDAKKYWETELALIDQELNIAMLEFSKIVQGDNFNFLISRKNLEILKTCVKEENIEITVEEKLLNYTAGAFSMRVAALEDALADERNKHNLTQEALKRTNETLAVLQERCVKNERAQKVSEDALRVRDAQIAQLELIIKAFESRFNRADPAAAAASNNPNGFFGSVPENTEAFSAASRASP